VRRDHDAAEGWLAGRFGIKVIFLASVIGFTVASALCGAATSLGELVFFRALQGVGGAGLVPLSQAILLQINPPERHGQAMAVFGIGTILGPIMGPALGGWLTYDYSWRWGFYINLPVGLLCTLGTLIFIRHTRHVHREPFDFVGFLTLSLGIGALQLMLDRGELKTGSIRAKSGLRPRSPGSASTCLPCIRSPPTAARF
jgi:MFS transporter, DHA2 family, multidrug resistance protein